MTPPLARLGETPGYPQPRGFPVNEASRHAGACGEWEHVLCMAIVPSPRSLVADTVTALPIPERAAYLRQLIHFAAGALAFTEGQPAAAEDIFRIADQMAAPNRPSPQ
jgi:hypothetical protein